MHLVNVKKAKYQEDFRILLSFDDGLSGIVDFKNFLFAPQRKAFLRLRDVDQFKKFSLKFNTLAWGEDLDLAPEYLHYLLVKQNGKKKLLNDKK